MNSSIIVSETKLTYFQVEETEWEENNSNQRTTRDSKKEITTHVSIHTVHLDGLKELYRQFLRLPDGAIVEVSLEHLQSVFRHCSL